MDILMIGHSRSGKTSYMAGLYKEFGDKGKGIGIWTSDSSKKERLERIANNISHGTYPSGTDISSEYNFWLQIDNRLVIPFDWYDYRGGALSESSKTSRDAQKLIERIESADAIIVFLDGEKIVYETDEEAEDDYEILLWAIQKAVSRKQISTGNYFPISFVVTKGDLYPGEPLIYTKDGINYYNTSFFEGLDYFLPFIKTIRESNTVAGMLTKCEVSRYGIENVLPPLLFSLYYGMNDYIDKRIDIINNEVDYYNKLDPNIVDDLFCGLDNLFGGNSKSDREMARESLKRINKEKENLKYLKSKKEKFWNDLNKLVKENKIIKF